MTPLGVPARLWPLVAAVFYAVGAAAHAWRPTLPWMLLLTPGFLFVFGALMLWAHVSSVPRPRAAFWWWFGLTALATLGLEILGVATGLVFGAYHYTSVLGPGLGGVPLVIGLNWVLVVLGMATVVQRLRLPVVVAALVVGLSCMAFDALLEPIAIALGYWVWADGTPGLQNYLAWGGIAAVASGAYLALLRDGSSPVLGWYTGIQALFFLALNLWVGLGWLP